MRAALAAVLVALLAAAPASGAFTDSARRPVGGAQAAAVFAPRSVAPPEVKGWAEQGQPLTATEGTWERQPERFALRWLRCAGDSCAAIDDATDVTYRPSSADVGHLLRIEVTATNAGGSAVARSAPTSPVTVPRPLSTALPSVSGTAMRGERLIAAPGAWTGASAFAYEWRRCPASGDGPCDPIAGATAATHTLTAADVGRRVRVAVHATNDGGTATALSSPTDPVLERTAERVYLLAVRRDDPSALFHFNDGGPWDSSGYGRHAVAPGVEFGAPGALAGSTAARLDGTGAYLDLRWSPTCGATGFTYEGWTLWQSNRDHERILDLGDAPGGSYLALTPHFGGGAEQMRPIVWVGGTGWDLLGAPPLCPGSGSTSR